MASPWDVAGGIGDVFSGLAEAAAARSIYQQQTQQAQQESARQAQMDQLKMQMEKAKLEESQHPEIGQKRLDDYTMAFRKRVIAENPTLFTSPQDEKMYLINGQLPKPMSERPEAAKVQEWELLKKKYVEMGIPPAEVARRMDRFFGVEKVATPREDTSLTRFQDYVAQRRKLDPNYQPTPEEVAIAFGQQGKPGVAQMKISADIQKRVASLQHAVDLGKEAVDFLQTLGPKPGAPPEQLSGWRQLLATPFGDPQAMWRWRRYLHTSGKDSRGYDAMLQKVAALRTIGTGFAPPGTRAVRLISEFQKHLPDPSTQDPYTIWERTTGAMVILEEAIGELVSATKKGYWEPDDGSPVIVPPPGDRGFGKPPGPGPTPGKAPAAANPAKAGF